jgi:hypothetical protein
LLFVLLGLILAPAGMPGGAAMASDHHGAAAITTSHHDMSAAAVHSCTEKQRPADKKAPDDCCLMTCVAMAVLDGGVAAPLRLPPGRQPIPLAADGSGLDPEAATPPPRSS